MLTELQSRVARTMAVNRSEESYFAGGAVLNEHTVRLSDDLDVFTDVDGIIPDVVDLDLGALRRDGLKVTVDLEIHGRTEVMVREGANETRVRWMSETRMRFFPLQVDPLWGLRLHMSDLAVNKVLAASTRRQTRDVLDLALIRRNFCPLGPLFLGASIKIGSLSPLALLDNARQRAVSVSNIEMGVMRGLPENWNAATVKRFVLECLDMAEEFLLGVPEEILRGLPVNAEGVPVQRVEAMADLRKLNDGGGRFPDFADAVSAFT